MKLKDCIRFLVMLAFVVTTMPTIGHAAMPSKTPVKTEQTQDKQAKDEHDCCPKGKQASKKHCPEDMASNEGKTHPDKNGCCDKNGKCVSNSCTNTSKVSSFDNGYLYSPQAEKTKFSFSHESAATGLTDRIKRPPRA